MAPTNSIVIPSCITVTKSPSTKAKSNEKSKTLTNKYVNKSKILRQSNAEARKKVVVEASKLEAMESSSDDSDFNPNDSMSSSSSSSSDSDYVEEVKDELVVLQDLEVEEDALDLFEERYPSLNGLVDYASSFTVAQLALGVAELGLQGAASLLSSGSETASSLARTSRSVRRRGAKAAGSRGSSLYGLANLTGVNYVLGLAGLKLKIRRDVPMLESLSMPTEAELIAHAEGTKMLSTEKLETYFSGDSDFVPEDGELEDTNTSESSSSDEEEESGSMKPVLVRVEMTGKECLKDLGKETSEEVVFEDGHCMPKILKQEPVNEVIYEDGHCLPIKVKEEPVDEVLDFGEGGSDGFQEIIDHATEFVGRIVSESIDESLNKSQ